MTVQYEEIKRIPRPMLWSVHYRASKRIWEGFKNHQLVFQKCKKCGSYLHPPRPMCPKCQAPLAEMEWVPSTGKGKVYSWVTYRRPEHRAFKVPYSVVLVELEEGVRMVSNMIDCKPEEIQIGMPVEVVFEDLAEDLTLPKFKRVG